MNYKDKLPEATGKRLVQLLTLLSNWSDEKITTKEISSLTGWKDSLVRHDLFLVNKLVNNFESENSNNGSDRKAVRGVSNGYSRNDLISLLKSVIGTDSKNCCIVGLGRLGAALLDESLTSNSEFHIKAGFDSNINRVEILRSTFPLYPANEMQYILKKENIEYAILTVSDNSAQQMADRLVKAEIKGIVNMTNVILQLPENVKVQNLSIKNALHLVT